MASIAERWATAMSTAEVDCCISSVETRHVLVLEPFGSVPLGLLVIQVGLRLLDVGFGPEHHGFAGFELGVQVVVFQDDEELPLLDLRPLFDQQVLNPADHPSADVRLVPRSEVTLGAEELFGLARGHRLDLGDAHFRL